MLMKSTNSSCDILKGLEVSFQLPHYAIYRQGNRVCVGGILELEDDFVVSVIVREDDTEYVDYLSRFETCHHVIGTHDYHLLYCSYLSLPRFILAMRNNRRFARFVINCPLDVVGDHL